MPSSGHLSLRFALSALLSVSASACLPDARMKIDYNDQPRALDDGWMVSTPVAEGFDAERLRGAYELFFEEDEYVTAISLLVVRHGKLVAEGYCRDLDDIGRLNAIQSATKSVTSILTGMAIADGYLEGVDQALYDIIPDKFDGDVEKRGITIRDLLTMRAGLRFSNDAYSRQLLIDGKADSLTYILAKPLDSPPGTEFDYMDASPHLMAGVLQRAMGQTLEEYASERLFHPLGVEDWVWETYRDGITYGAVGLYLTPRDLAKLGQLMLQDGAWMGEQLVPQAWVAESTAPLVDTDMTEAHGYRYGYYWWTMEHLGAFTADGHGGQFFFVVPDEELVIVMTAEPHTEGSRVAINLDDFEPLATMILDSLSDRR